MDYFDEFLMIFQHFRVLDFCWVDSGTLVGVGWFKPKPTLNQHETRNLTSTFPQLFQHSSKTFPTIIKRF